MANVNATQPIRFENGATIKIDGDPILNVNPGTLSWSMPIRKRIEYTDRGVQQNALEGDDDLTEISLDVKATKLAASALLDKVIVAGTAGVAKLHAFIITQYDYRGATTGYTVTWANCWLAEKPGYKAGGAGDGLDTWTFKFRGPTAPALAVIP